MASDLFAGVLPFLHVAEELSFRRAAARLGVTVAAVSKAVGKLEAELGVTLLDRTSRSVALTEEGAAFLARCRDAVDAIRAGREVAAQARGLVAGVARLSLSPILARPVVAELGRLVGRHPKLAVQLVVTDRLVRLVEEEVDVALRVGALDDSTLIARPLYASRWTTVASAAYLATHGTPRSVEALASHRRVAFVSPRGKARAWSFATGTLDAPAVIQLDHGELLVEAALAGVGVVQVLDFMVHAPLRDGRLIELLSDQAALGPPIHAVCSARRRQVPRVKAVLELLTELFARLTAEARARARQ